MATSEEKIEINIFNIIDAITMEARKLNAPRVYSYFMPFLLFDTTNDNVMVNIGTILFHFVQFYWRPLVGNPTDSYPMNGEEDRNTCRTIIVEVLRRFPILFDKFIEEFTKYVAEQREKFATSDKMIFNNIPITKENILAKRIYCEFK